MTKYQDVKQALRPKDKKKLIGLMKQAYKLKKNGKTVTLHAKLNPKHR